MMLPNRGVIAAARSSGIDLLLDFDSRTITRASEGFRFTSSLGVGDWPAANTWRKTSILAPNGLPYYILEGQRTNLITQSEDLSTWTQNNTPVLTGGQAAPDGANDAYQIADNDAGAYESIQRDFNVSGSTQYTASIWIKKDSDTTRFPEVQIAEVTGGTGVVAIDLNTQTGAVAQRTASGFTNLLAEAHDHGTWWRLTIRFTTTASTTVARMIVFPSIGTTLGAATVAATGSIIAWGAQVEQAAAASTPIRTAGATATRNVDVVQAFAAGDAFRAATRFQMYWRPGFSSASGQSAALLWAGSGGATFYAFDVASGRVRIVETGVGAKVQSNVLTWDAWDEILIDVTRDNGAAGSSMTISGANTGNGATAGSAFTWPGNSLLLNDDAFSQRAWSMITAPFAP